MGEGAEFAAADSGRQDDMQAPRFALLVAGHGIEQLPDRHRRFGGEAPAAEQRSDAPALGLTEQPQGDRL